MSATATSNPSLRSMYDSASLKRLLVLDDEHAGHGTTFRRAMGSAGAVDRLLDRLGVRAAAAG